MSTSRCLSLFVFFVGLLSLVGCDWFSGGSSGEEVPKVFTAPVTKAPLPKGREMVPNPGVAAYGFAPDMVDPAGLLALLYAKKFDMLDEIVREVQAEFEADPGKEYWVRMMYGGFGFDDPDAAALFDAWIAARPDSFAGYLARAQYRMQLAWHGRGTGAVSKTSKARFAAMRQALPGARADAEAAIEKHPKLAMAHHLLMSVAQLEGNKKGVAKAYQGVVETCPSCVFPKMRRHGSLKVKWGGEPGAAAKYAEEELAQIKENPRLAALAGDLATSTCLEVFNTGDMAATERKCSEAIATFPRGRAYLYRGLARLRMGDARKGRDDVFAAAAQEPQSAEFAMSAARQARERGEIHAWAKMLLRTARLNPGESGLAYNMYYAPRDIPMMAGFYVMRGEREKAEQLCDWLGQIVPARKDAQTTCKVKLASSFKPDPAKLKAAEAAKARPTDREVALEVDRAFFKSRTMWPIIYTWTLYLDAHPEDAKAWEERGGSWTHLGSLTMALADTERACKLGSQSACGVLPALRSKADAR